MKRPRRTGRGPERTIDPDLVGLWSLGPRRYRYAADGTHTVIDVPAAYTVSADGSELHFAGETRRRVYGSVQSLVGVWDIEYPDGGDVWREESHYRADGTYTGQWTLNGVFDSLYFGTYTDDGSRFVTEERRAIVTTPGGGAITYDPPFDPVVTGTYAVDTGAGTLTVTTPDGTAVFQKVAVARQ